MENAKKDIMIKTESTCNSLSPSNSKHNSTFPVEKIKKIPPPSVGKVVKPKITLKLQIPKKEPSDESKIAASPSQLCDEASNTYEFSDKESETHVKKEYVYAFKLLSHHIVKRKQGTKMYKCDVCGATYRHVFSLKRHFLRNHVNYRYLSEADISNCKINFTPDDVRPETLKSGSSVTIPEQSVNKFKSPESVPHELQPNEKACDLFRCHRCLNMKFDSLVALRQHFEMHQGNTKAQFSCDHCDAVFAQRLAFIRHKSSHINKKLFVCSTCELNFDSRSSYIKHVSTHSNGKACKHCGKVFSTSANRKRHERLHEGLKPYPCRHCSLGFTQSNDLRSHIKELHRDLYFECSQCSKLLPSQESLRKHVTEKHSVAAVAIQLETSSPKVARPLIASQSALKTLQPNSLNQILPKPRIVSKPVTSPPTSLAKVFTCNICKKSFPSYLRLSSHKNNAHTWLHGRRKSHRKMKLSATSSVLKKKVMSSTRSRELTEQEFYLSVSDQIVDNLINYVDGKPSQLSLKQSETVLSSEPFAGNSGMNMSESWSSYNFPEDFDMGQSFQHKKGCFSDASDCQSVAHNSKLHEVPSPEKRIDAMALDSDLYSETVVNSAGSPSAAAAEDSDELCQEMSLEERKALIGRDVKVACICCICTETFESYQLYCDHQVNNHPNVQSSYLELEGTKDDPPFVPPGICKQFVTPSGLLGHCYVPPSLSDQTNLICTKCKSKFPCMSDLHTHMIACGGNESTVPTFVYKKHQRRIKRTMKNRIDTTVRHAYFVKKPVKISVESSSKHSREKLRKATFSVNTPLLLSPAQLKKSSDDFVSKLHTESKQSFVKESKYVCPVCDQLFKTKNILKAHVIRCRREMPVVTGNIHDGRIQYSSAQDNTVLPPAVDSATKVCSLPDRESERHGASSPSLECIVDSIKQKLTSDDLSSSHSSSSWMDEEPPDISLEDEPGCSTETNGSEQNSDNINHVENPICDSQHFTVEEMDLPVLVEESNPEFKRIIPCEANGRENAKMQLKELDNADCPIPTLVQSNGDSLNSDVQFTVERVMDSSEVNQKVDENKECQDSKLKTENSGESKFSCPYCRMKFSYTVYFRKHMDGCTERENKVSETKPTNLLHLPNKEEVEASMINLMRHQTRQSEMMKEGENSACTTKKFQSYTCDLCHRIFLCYFKMLQHRVCHKLNPEELKKIPLQSKGSENKKSVNSNNNSTVELKDLPSSAETSVDPPVEETVKCVKLEQTAVNVEDELPSKTILDSNISDSDVTKSASSPGNSLLSHSDNASTSRSGKRKTLLPREEMRAKRKKKVMNLKNESQNSLADAAQVPDGISSPDIVSNKLDKSVKPECGVRTGNQFKTNKRKPQVHSSVPKTDMSLAGTSDVSSASGTGSHNKLTKRKPQENSLTSKVRTSSSALGLNDTPKTGNSIQNPKSKLNSESSALKARMPSDSPDVINVAPSCDSSLDDVTCPLCGKVFTAPFYKKRHVKHMHKVKEEKSKQAEQKKEKFVTNKVSKRRVLPKNNRRAFQRQCKKQVAKTVSIKQNVPKKTSPLRKSPPKKMPILTKKRSTRS